MKQNGKISYSTPIDDAVENLYLVNLIKGQYVAVLLHDKKIKIDRTYLCCSTPFVSSLVSFLNSYLSYKFVLLNIELCTCWLSLIFVNALRSKVYSLFLCVRILASFASYDSDLQYAYVQIVKANPARVMRLFKHNS